MLNIKNLHVKLEEEEKQILKGVNLSVESRAKCMRLWAQTDRANRPSPTCCPAKDGYEVTEGSAQLEGVDILDMEAEERAAAGLFLAFQYPVEIPGVGNMTVFAHGRECPAQIARRRGNERRRVLESRAGQGQGSEN